MGDRRFSLMVHGGAGTLDDAQQRAKGDAWRTAIGTVLAHGRRLLTDGASAVEVVESCVVLLEDDPLFNAGRGSVLNEVGAVEMDAAIMDGRDLAAGAVAGVHHLANPVVLASRLMRDDGPVMLAGEGAMRLAARCGLTQVGDDYFRLPERLAQLEQARAKQTTTLDHIAGAPAAETGKYGTVGAVARDLKGHLAAATSTGGMVNKRVGRVGDSPLIGAGVYADDETCAVSSTGHGEDFMRCVIAKTIADYIDMQGMDARQAVDAGIAYLVRRVQGLGGVIVIDRHGNCASGFTTRNMIHGWIEHGGDAAVRL